MILAVRAIGAFLLAMAILNLAAVVVVDPNQLISPATVTARYLLMLIAAIGYLFTRKWGVLVYAILVAYNWIAYFTVYDSQSIGPLWLSIPVPLAILVISSFAWRRLE